MIAYVSTFYQKKFNCNLSEVVGFGKDFNPSEVPTLRSVICKGLLLQEGKLHHDHLRKHFLLAELVEELAEFVSRQWQKSNSNFIEPVTIGKRSIEKKIRRKWDGLIDVINGRTSANLKQLRLDELDKIFDIVSCKHPIFLCGEEGSNCDRCEVGAHISCTCPRKSKIPIIELVWICSQRRKIGEHSDFQISNKDKQECERQSRLQKRKQYREGIAEVAKSKNKKMKIEGSEELLSSSSLDLASDSNFEPECTEGKSKVKEKSHMAIENTAAASIRYGISSGATAAIATGFLKDLIDSGYIGKEKSYLSADKNKIWRAQQEFMTASRRKSHMRCTDNWIHGLFFMERLTKQR